MKPVIAPIRPDDRGAEVANLHEALIALLRRDAIRLEPGRRDELLRALGDEQQTQVYRDATKEAVSHFQIDRQPDVNGLVDEVTATSLNTALRAIGALDETPDAREPSIVTGAVVEPEGMPFKGLVILFQEAEQGSIPLGERSTDPEGRYAIAYTLPTGAHEAKLRVAAFDADRQRRAEAVFRPAGAVEIVNLEVALDGRAYRISGQVRSDSRVGVGGLRIVIVDKNIGGDANLAGATTEPDGRYRAAFTYSGTKQKPDLQARAFHGDTFLGSSAVRYNASNVLTLDVAVRRAAATSLAAEHDTLTANLAVHFAGKLRELKETDDRQDITYLANKSGWDARAVALASLADEFSARTADAAGVAAIEPAWFYSLFRAGIATNNVALYRTDPARVEALWKHGIEQGVVPARLEPELPAALERFRTLAARQALDGPAVAGLSSLGEMLAVSLPDADVARREQFARLRIEHRGRPAAFWDAVATSFGEEVVRQLRLDGQLAYLTLNNAPLIGKLRSAMAEGPIGAPVGLVALGFHRAEKWQALIGEGKVPPEVSGESEAERRDRYAKVLATQVRLSYPTATQAAMVKSGETPTTLAAADKVHDFLMQHHDKFEIGNQTIEQFVALNNIAIEPEVRDEITRIQRVRQITPGDAAMNALLRRGVDSAYAVVRYDRDEFVGAFKDDVGGETHAALIHAKAQQVHGAVLNVALSYLVASNAPPIGVHSPPHIVDPAPKVPEHVGDVIAYASLEKLLGEMDYCECQHCRSILSPAAYFVDLLHFLDRDDKRWTDVRAQWKATHDNVPYPHAFAKQQEWVDAGSPPEVVLTPLEVLLSRRPDLQHLLLTCENTNTPLPYIDLVNETLEHFVLNGLTLENYRGHSTDDAVTPEDLLANPQFVHDAAYAILAGRGNPAPLLPPTLRLPFHQPLERVRRLLRVFESPLPRVLEAFRKNDSLERADEANYGWRDIWMEELQLTRAEHRLLTDRTVGLQSLYGFPPATTGAEVLQALSNAKALSRRLEIGYDDLLQILETRFINPHGVLIPKLQRLGVPFKSIKDLKDGSITGAQFDAALTPQLNAAAYGGDIKAWVTDPANYDRIMGLMLLADPSGASNTGSFDRLEFRYADPAKLAQAVRPFEFVRLQRFVRLWKRLGWSVEHTDKAIGALYPGDQATNDVDDDVNLQRLDAGFLVLLPRLGVIRRVMDRLQLKVPGDLLPLLACFAPMDTHGTASLYRRLFSSPSFLAQDPAFADDGFGNVLTGTAKLWAHEEALRAALTLTASEFVRIGEALGHDADTPLTIDTVSQVFRRGWLARTLKLSVPELLRLAHCSDIDPFAPIDPVAPTILALIEMVQRLRAAPLKPSQALYLVWNEDIPGASAPDPGQVDAFARGLRSALAATESEFATADDPDGQVARARMALVYDSPTTDLFFGLLNGTLITEAPYNHGQPALQQAITDAAPGRVAYDDFRKRLSFSGAMSAASRDALKAVAGVSDEFKSAIEKLHVDNQKIVVPFFARFPELRPLHDDYVSSNEPADKKRTLLLASFLPALKARRKLQQAVQAIGSAAGIDSTFAQPTLCDARVLHAVTRKSAPAVDDLVAIETPGLSAEFFFRSTATGTVDRASDAEPVLDYRASGPVRLSGNGNPISGIWRGYVEAPATDFYNLRVEADAGAGVTLHVGGADVGLTRNGNSWTNDSPIELRAGMLYLLTMRVEKVKDNLSLSWQSRGRGWEIVPSRCCYPATSRDRLNEIYTRFLKTASLARALKLTPGEIAHLASHADYRIDDEGWLNWLAVAGRPDGATAKALHRSLDAMLAFSRLKGALSPDDERLLQACRDPVAATANPQGLLFALTRWDAASLDALLARFGKSRADLAHLDTLMRVSEAFDRLTALGVSATAMSAVATNEPDAAVARNLQAALRARHAESDWLALVKPINDELRALQRDALVAYILHQMRSAPESAHIDTADKLFEYFLMDVQTAPCMQTSRIRHALSSVQLFVERCLMSLEPRVASSVVNAKHWQWMRRYRVWEANRKVFLWPENWLEPELRDDASPFFKELMSDLLQGDITEARAASAMASYLSKLAEVDKLELCGMHVVENDMSKLQDDVVHVVARRPGPGRKYYYRRREDGSWTPWEEIKLDIEDNPVVPVVWKGRLFLFWLRILKQSDPGGSPLAKAPADRTLAALVPGDLERTPPTVTIQALLCWSEYVDHQWQAVRISDLDRPTTIGTRSVEGPFVFERFKLALVVTEESHGLRIRINGATTGSFLLHTTHSLPMRGEEAAVEYVKAPGRFMVPFSDQLTLSPGTLNVDYDPGTGTGDDNVSRDVLSYKRGGRTVSPLHGLQDPWDAPFFFEDTPHAFYVTTEQETMHVDQWNEYDVVPDGPSLKLPPLYYEKPKLIPDLLGPIVTDPRVRVTDPSPLERFVSEDAYIKRAIGMATAVSYGDVRIGPAGQLGPQGGTP